MLALGEAICRNGRTANKNKDGGIKMAPPKPTGTGFGHWMARVGTALHSWLYRISGGRIGGSAFSAPVLVLTTTGAKTGKERRVAILYLKTDDGYVVVASYGGADRSPAWFANLSANPSARIQVGGEEFPVTAAIVDSERKAKLWPELVAMYADYQIYQDRTDRDIPVVLLTPA